MLAFLIGIIRVACARSLAVALSRYSIYMKYNDSATRFKKQQESGSSKDGTRSFCARLKCDEFISLLIATRDVSLLA